MLLNTNCVDNIESLHDFIKCLQKRIRELEDEIEYLDYELCKIRRHEQLSLL